MLDLELPGTNLDPIWQSVLALALPTDDAGKRWNCRTATYAWLASRKSEQTRRAYFREIAFWTRWAEESELDIREARRADVDLFMAGDGGESKKGERLSPRSFTRRLSAISSWYDYLVSNEVCGHNPVSAVERPSIDKAESAAVALSPEEARALMTTARRATTPNALRDAAAVGFMVILALRVDEVINLNLSSLSYNQGHRTVTVVGKGNKFRTVPIPPPLSRDIDEWLEVRGSEPGPLFHTYTGRRLVQTGLFTVVRRLAKEAGVAAADRIGNHSLRHTSITLQLAQGADIRLVQEMAGHSSVTTTMLYDHRRQRLDMSPVYLLTGVFAHED